MGTVQFLSLKRIQVSTRVKLPKHSRVLDENNLRREAKMALTPEEIELVNSRFKKIDTDDSGEITRDEAREFFREFFGEAKEGGFDFIFMTLFADADKDGKVTLEEFLASAEKVKAAKAEN